MTYLKLFALLVGLAVCAALCVFMFVWFVVFFLGLIGLMLLMHCCGFPIVVKHAGKRVGVLKFFQYYPDRYRF